jgi:hypothetical protein
LQGFEEARVERLACVVHNRTISRPGVDMLLSLFSTLAVGLAIIMAILTLVIPFTLGLFDRRDTQ